VGTNSAEIWVRIAPDADYEKTLAAVRRTAEATPGVVPRLRTYEDESSGSVLSTPSDDVDVRVFGERYGLLERKADEIKRRLAGVSGLGRAQVSGVPIEQPTIRVAVNLKAALRHEIRPGDVRRELATLVSGLTVGNFFQG